MKNYPKFMRYWPKYSRILPKNLRLWPKYLRKCLILRPKYLSFFLKSLRYQPNKFRFWHQYLRFPPKKIVLTKSTYHALILFLPRLATCHVLRFLPLPIVSCFGWTELVLPYFASCLASNHAFILSLPRLATCHVLRLWPKTLTIWPKT